MAWPTSNFPTSIDVITDKVDNVDDVVAADINGGYDCIEKLEAKVGVDSSAVATSLDYKVSNVASVDPGHKHTTVTATGDVTIESTGAGVNITTDTDAGDDVAINTSMLVVEGDSGNVGIGTANPGGKLHSYSASSGILASGVADEIIAENSGDSGVSVLPGASNEGYFIVGSGNATSGWMKYNRSSNFMDFYTAGSHAMRINSSGNVGIGTESPGYPLEVTGNAYFSADVSALTFTDRTPHYDGDALADIKKIKGNDGGIDHNSLPKFAQSKIKDKDIETTGRDLGAMISILTKAVQQISDRLDALEA